MRQTVYEIKQADYDALPSEIHKLVALKMITEGKIKIIDELKEKENNKSIEKKPRRGRPIKVDLVPPDQFKNIDHEYRPFDKETADIYKKK